MTRETKIFPGYVLKADEDTGIVEAYVSVMGIIDEDIPPDLIENGSYTKTIQEHGPAGTNKIRVLHQHRWSEVIGKPLVIVEHSRDQLPPELLEKFPKATGGLFTSTQFILDVQRAREDFALYKAGAMNEWSVGIDVLQHEMDKTEDGVSFRRIKEIRLWEYSPVTWGANQATITTDVKDKDVDDEDKDVLLVEPSKSDEHLQDEAEPSTTLTSCEAARLNQDGIDADFNLVFRKVQDG